MSLSVAKPTPAAERLIESASLGRVLMGGTKAMRQTEQAYLPRFPAESNEAYQARLNSSFPFNGFNKDRARHDRARVHQIS